MSILWVQTRFTILQFPFQVSLPPFPINKQENPPFVTGSSCYHSRGSGFEGGYRNVAKRGEDDQQTSEDEAVTGNVAFRVQMLYKLSYPKLEYEARLRGRGILFDDHLHSHSPLLSCKRGPGQPPRSASAYLSVRLER